MSQADPVLATEMQRYRAGQQMAKFDSERYNMKEPPQSKKNDIATWQTCIQNAHSQLEHQLNRCVAPTCMLIKTSFPVIWHACDVGLVRLLANFILT